MSPSKLCGFAAILSVLVLWGASLAWGQASAFKFHVISPSNLGLRVQTDATGGQVASFGWFGSFQVDKPVFPGGRLAIVEDGRVGIGTASPSDTLTVVGTIQSTAGGIRFPDGSVQTSAAVAPAAVYMTSQFADPGTGSAMTPVAHLNLPSGTYWLLASMFFRNNVDTTAPDNNRDVTCQFTGDFRTYRYSLPGAGSATVTLQSVLTVSSGGADLACVSPVDPNVLFSVVIIRGRLTALKLDGSLTAQ